MKRTKLLFSLVLLFSITCTSPLPSQISSKDLEKKVDAFFVDIAGKQMPGSAVLVVKDGKILLNKGYGMANLEHGIPITQNTVFDLASVSKQFAGFAISSLVEQGKISLQDDIRKYIPELPKFKHTITIDHLVHHISGVKDWTSTLPLSGWSFDDVISFDQILRTAFAHKELNFEPGSEYTYSNTGYNLLAELVQRITGQSFREWTHENIFQPLDMTNTLFLDNHTEIIPNRANGYFKGQNGQFQVKPNNLMALGSSSMYSTTTDLAKWVMNLDQPKEGMQPIIERMFQRGKLNNGTKISYAFGLGIGEYRNTKRISHSGSWASFRTYLVYFPEYHLSIVVLNNYQSRPSRTAFDIAALFIEEQAQKSNADQETVRQASAEVSTKVLDDYTGTYRLGPAWYVTITRKGDQLWTQATNEDIYPMTTRSDSLFWIKDYGGRTMTFIRDKTNQVTHVKYAGKIHPKMKGNSTLDSDAMKNFLGVYENEELQTKYTVTLEGNQLILKHHRSGTFNLTQAWKDDFSGSRWFLGSVEFQRDEQSKVTGFKATSHRARNIWFKKVN